MPRGWSQNKSQFQKRYCKSYPLELVLESQCGQDNMLQSEMAIVNVTYF